MKSKININKEQITVKKTPGVYWKFYYYIGTCYKPSKSQTIAAHTAFCEQGMQQGKGAASPKKLDAQILAKRISKIAIIPNI